MNTKLIVILIPLSISLIGCGTNYNMKLSATLPPIDTTSISPKMKKYSKIMVIPPSGEGTQKFDSTISLFEAEFLKNGLTVISGAVTGRIVIAQETVGDKLVEGAAKLTDIERALVMAKKTGAEAVLQIGEFRWSSGNEEPYRYMIADHITKSFREVDKDTYENAPVSEKWYFNGNALKFIGRLIEVDTGQVVASFNMTTSTTFCLPRDYQQQILVGGKWPVYVQNSASYNFSETNNKAGLDRCMEQVIRLAAKHLRGSLE